MMRTDPCCRKPRGRSANRPCGKRASDVWRVAFSSGVLGGEAEAGAFYRHVVSLWDDPADIVISGNAPLGPLDDWWVHDLVPDAVERMQAAQTKPTARTNFRLPLSFRAFVCVRTGFA